MLNKTKIKAVAKQIVIQALTSSSKLTQQQFQQALAENIATSNQYYQNEKLQLFPPLPHFKVYGVGTYLFFQFLHKLIFLLIFLCLLSAGPIVINLMYGTYYSSEINSLGFLIAKTSLGNHNYSQLAQNDEAASRFAMSRLVNMIFDGISCISILLFCFYWKHKSTKIENQLNRLLNSISSKTVEAIVQAPFPAPQQISSFMSKFQLIEEVAQAPDISSQMQITKKIVQLQSQIRETELEYEQSLIASEGEQRTKLVVKINGQYKLLQKMYMQVNTQIEKVPANMKYFIQFTTIEGRNIVISQFDSYNTILECCFQKPQKFLIKGKQVKVRACDAQPSCIQWEAPHVFQVQRFFLTLLQIVLSLLCICLGSLITSCLQLLLPGSGISANSDINTNLTWTTLLNIALSLFIMLVRKGLQQIVSFIANYQKYETTSEKIAADMTRLYLLDLFSANILTFLAKGNFFGVDISFVSKVITLLGQTQQQTITANDGVFNSTWYFDVGYQIWLNVLMFLLVPVVVGLVSYYVMQKFNQYKARKQKTIEKLKSMLLLPQFYFSIQSSSLMLIISQIILFSGGVPLLSPLLLFGLLIKYYYFKFVFIRYCRLPPLFNARLNTRFITIMKVMLVLRCFISLAMYAADGVASRTTTAISQWANQLDIPGFSTITVFIRNIFTSYQYGCFCIAVILGLVLEGLVKKLIEKCRKKKIHPEIEYQMDDNAQASSLKRSKIQGNELQMQQGQSNINIIAFQSEDTEQQQKKLDAASPLAQIRSYKFQNNVLYNEARAILKAAKEKRYPKKSLKMVQERDVIAVESV